MLVGYKLNCWK